MSSGDPPPNGSGIITRTVGGFLDDLARSMAAAVTRRDATRMLVGAVIGSMVPAARAWGLAQNYPCKEGSFNCSCPNPYKGNYRLCCPGDRRCQCITLAAVCVPDPCPGPTCGAHHCCLADEVCADAKSGTCCKTGEDVCTIIPEFSTDAVSRGRCCPPTKPCASSSKAAACCNPGQGVTDLGDCCDKGQVCGAQCCGAGLKCDKGRCVRKDLH